MFKEFTDTLREFLDSETSDYSISYLIGDIDDSNQIEVVTWMYGDNKNSIKEDTKNSTYWQWDSESKSLMIEMGEDTDSWYTLEHYGWTVKYFWMMVAPYLFKI